MEDGPYKDAQIMVRIAASDLPAMHDMAAGMGMKLAALTRLLLERFHAAHLEHGDRLVWPPRYAHFAPEAQPRDEALPTATRAERPYPTHAPRRVAAADADTPASADRRSPTRHKPKEA